MTKEKVAEALGVATHNIPPLVRSGLLKPLGHPGRYCVKHFSRDALAEKFASPEWLDKVVAAIHRHWRNKNARKRAAAGPTGCPRIVTRYRALRFNPSHHLVGHIRG